MVWTSRALISARYLLWGHRAGASCDERPARVGERGSATVLVACTVGMLALGLWWLGQLAGGALDRSRAQNAADAAALAAASEGADGDAAAEVAAANGAELKRVVETNDGAAVRVELGMAVAAAQATGDERDTSMTPALRAALAQAARVLGHPVEVEAVLESGSAVWVSEASAAELVGREEMTGLCLSPSPLARPCVWQIPLDPVG